MDFQTALNTVLDNHDLEPDDMRSVMRTIMSGGATSAQIAALLIALRCKGESVSEITVAAQVMRELATKIDVTGPHVVDTCGTGGDASGTFNISTAAAFVVAAAGGKVAKHGNRSVSSRSGSADVLEAAGVNLDLDAGQVKRCVDEIGVGFLFAPRLHGAMKHAIGPRREIGVRTLFNLLGPLSNPASAPNQLLGVFAESWLEPLAKVLQQLDSEHVLLVHAEDGLDEISVAAATHVVELTKGRIDRYTVTPEQFGIIRVPLATVAVDNIEASLAMVRAALGKNPGPARDIVALNAGAAIHAANLAESLAEGVERAQAAIDDGSARRKMDELIDFSRSLN